MENDKFKVKVDERWTAEVEVVEPDKDYLLDGVMGVMTDDKGYRIPFCGEIYLNEDGSYNHYEFEMILPEYDDLSGTPIVNVEA